LCPHGFFFMRTFLKINHIDLDKLTEKYPVYRSDFDENGELLAIDDASDVISEPAFDYTESSGVVVYPDCYGIGDLDNQDFDTSLEAELSLWELGRCIDFGSGEKRLHCNCLNVVEHVEQKFTVSKCVCGARIVPYFRYFKSEEIDTFVAINSVQNNSVKYLSYLFSYIQKMMWGFIVSVPKVLHHNENDPGDIIFQLFPTVEIVDYSSCRFYKFRKKSDVQSTGKEILVNVGGDPIDERRDGSFRFVACLGINGNDIYGVKADSGPLDFVAAGHLRYGEKVLDGMRREWIEEMITPSPKFHFLGRVDSMHNKDITFVFLAELQQPKCIPSRGIVVALVSTSLLRYSFQYSLYMLKNLREWTVNVDTLAKVNFRNALKAKSGVKSNKKRMRPKVSRVQLEQDVSKKMAEIKVYRNGNWVQVSVLRNVVNTGVKVIVNRNMTNFVSDTLQVLYMGLPIAMAKFEEGVDDKLIYVVTNVMVGYSTLASAYRTVNAYSYVNPIKLVQDLYAVDAPKADRMLRACGGKIPIFEKSNGSMDWESHGVFRADD